MFNTFVKIRGKCAKTQMNPNEMSIHRKQTYGDGKQRTDMFLKEGDENEDTHFDLTELKEHLKTLPPNETHNTKNFDRPE